MSTPLDLILVGGGLANGVLAQKLLVSRPELNFVVIEKAPVLGGNHTWSFHEGDVSEGDFPWLEPLVTATWDKYEVRFPQHHRILRTSYHAIRSKPFHQTLKKKLGDRLRLNTGVSEIRPDRVVLSHGETLSAKCVIDGRGWETPDRGVFAYQKFLGQSVTFAEPHGLFYPLLMDATIPQRDGFQFFYLLPWSDRSVLIENTFYSDTPELNEALCREEIRGYAKAKGWRIISVDEEETGQLPIPLASFSLAWQSEVPVSGMRAGLFHATTGYSLPFAVRFANLIANLPEMHPDLVSAVQSRFSRRVWNDADFLRFLNRMIIRGARPDQRYRILERFYRLPEPLIERFYAGRLNWRDRARILLGRPPIPIGKALLCLIESEL